MKVERERERERDVIVRRTARTMRRREDTCEWGIILPILPSGSGPLAHVASMAILSLSLVNDNKGHMYM